ncbi:MAG TPA: LysM peptidoglycan-binding domain-containing protein, partial [Opitutaceae bacterium]
MGILSPVRQSLDSLVPGLPLADLLLGEIRQFDHGFVFEIVDLAKGGKPIRTKSLVLNPSRYNLSEPFTSTLTPSEDNAVVTEENGIIIREITIEGTTGLQRRKETALGRGGAVGTEASGPDHFRDLRDLFREYGRLKVDPERGPNIRMLFHNVLEDDHFVVVPRAFETPRDAATNPIHFVYRITLAAIQTIPAPKPAKGPFDDLGEFGDTLQAISEGVNDARAFFVDSINEVEALRRRIQLVGDIVSGDVNPSEALDRIFESSASNINAAHDLIDNTETTILTGRELWKASLDLEEDFRENILNNITSDASDDDLRAAKTLKDMTGAMTRILFRGNAFFAPPVGEDVSRPYAGERNFTDQDLRDETAGATPGSRTRGALGSERRAGLDLGSFSGSERYQVTITDTLDNIALRFRVPRETIIDFNNLRFPYIAAGGGPG